MGSKALAFIAGGLLEGVGKGMAAQGKAKRERARATLEYQRQLQRDDRQLKGRRGLLTQESALASERDKATGERATTRLKLQIGSAAGEGAKDRLSREKIAGIGATSRVESTKARASGADKRARMAAKSRKEAADTAAKSRVESARITAGKKTDTTAAEKRIIESHTELVNGVPVVDWSAAAADMFDRGMTVGARSARRKAQRVEDREKRAELTRKWQAKYDELESSFGYRNKKIFKGLTEDEWVKKNVEADMSGDKAPTPGAQTAPKKSAPTIEKMSLKEIQDLLADKGAVAKLEADPAMLQRLRARLMALREQK